MAERFADPYLDPTTGTLRNRVGAVTDAELAHAEADLGSARLEQLLAHPVRPTGDLDEFQAIHRQLFQDVYDWAGRIRTVDIRKNAGRAEFFLPCSVIDRAGVFAAEELRKDNMLRGPSRDEFIERLAVHYDAFNYIHPFREGNGRTQRAFWNRVARDAGWRLNWLQVSGDANDRASRAAAEEQDLEPLKVMFAAIVSRVPVPE